MRRESRKWEDGWWNERFGPISISYQGKTYAFGSKPTKRFQLSIGRKFDIRWGFM